MKRMDILPETRAINSHDAGVTKQIALPNARLDAIMLQVQYTVTDVGIEAGENFDGWLKHLKVGEGSNLPVEVYTDELTDLTRFAASGKSATGHFKDGLPTTAEEQLAYFILEGPFQLTDMAQPVMELAVLAATDEWPAASAMSAVVKVGVIYSRTQYQQDPGIYFNRYKTPVGTVHDVPLGFSLVDATFVKTSAAISKFALKEADGEGGASTTVEAISGDDPTLAEALWAQWTRQAYTANSHLLLGDVNPYANRKLWIQMTSGTALVFARNVVA